MSADQEQKDFTAKDARTTPLSQAQSRSGRLRNTKNQESAQSETFVTLESSGADPSSAKPAVNEVLVWQFRRPRDSMSRG